MAREILTTLVGAQPVPDWFSPALGEQALQDATAVLLKSQELAGLDLLVDGEFNRWDPDHPETDGKIEYFIQRLKNVRTGASRAEERMFAELAHLRFRNKPAGVVEGLIGEGTLNLERDFLRVRQLTQRPLKFTITSPYMLGRILVDRQYHTREELVSALADVLAGQVRDIQAEVVQINEEVLTGNPADGVWVADALNRIFAVVPRKSALHMCFGNYGGQPVQQGNYAQLVDFINLLHVDHVLLELARRGPEELAAIRDIKPAIGIGLGVIDVKSTVIEAPDEVARAIERADKALGPGRLKYVTPDCGMWMHRRSVAEGKMSALVRGRDLYLGDSKD
ncbi:MAG TPA: methionine synthase [Phycisphaerae bacterium]|nr:methionine synthase [Phycisphaerae bacterium]